MFSIVLFGRLIESNKLFIKLVNFMRSHELNNSLENN